MLLYKNIPWQKAERQRWRNVYPGLVQAVCGWQHSWVLIVQKVSWAATASLSGSKEQTFQHQHAGSWSVQFYHFSLGARFLPLSTGTVRALATPFPVLGEMTLHPHGVRSSFLDSDFRGIRIYSGLRSTWKSPPHYFNAYLSLAICPVFLLQKYPL